MLNDPTYNKEEILKNLEWHLAFVLSEILNDAAPIGWSKYIPMAKQLQVYFFINPKPS